MVKKKQLKLLIIIPNLGRGGAQQVFHDQLQFYSGYFNTIGCVFNLDDTFKDDRKNNIISLNIPAGKSWMSKIYFFLRRVSALKKIKKEHSIDFSISHLEGADYVNILSKKKEKVVCWIHGTKSFDKNIEGILGSIRKKILIPLTYKRSDLIVTVSDGIRQELINDFDAPASKIKTIYNGFDLKELSIKASQDIKDSFEVLFDRKKVLIKHCRLSRQKNLFALLDIFTLIKDEPDVKLMILGDGELREELLDYCKSTNLRAYSIWDTSLHFNLDYNIYFLGYERNPYPYLRRASLYLMTSAWEGFPLALCEAMACELPVLSSDCYTGPREIIDPELNLSQPINDPITTSYGILMPMADRINYEIWAQTIVATLHNLDLLTRLKQQGKERIKSFDRKEITSQWLQILE